MNWIELSSNTTQWKAIFGNLTPPKEMHVMHAVFEGNGIKLKIAAPMIGENLPEKWKKQYNYFHFDTYIIGVSNLTIDNFTFSGVAQIQATKNENLNIHINIANCKITCQAEVISILNISGFHNDFST